LGVRPAWAEPGAPTLGRYWLGPRLGRGGIGEVYEAWDTLLRRRIAVKTLTVPLAASILRFMQEAQLQARVTHPNVCRIYDLDASMAAPFIAMQLVRGPNLMQAAPFLTLHEAVEILAVVAQAIHAAHRLQLIHRDIKPFNILLEPDGAGGWATYVADFGLAKDLTGPDQTGADSAMGTPEYMAPEQKRGEAGPATDVFALGVTLEVVLGAARNGGSACHAATAVPWALPGKLRLIIGRCREPRPQDRYHSAGELAEDLRRFLDGEPLLAERDQWRRLGMRWLRRHPTWSVSLALTLLLGTGFGAWSARLRAMANRQTALAHRFAMDVRDMENHMRVERLIPIHDLRPTLAHMRERLERIQSDMASLGPEARGPGSLALGRGYCSLGDLDQAQAVLERAWPSYRTPEMASALSRLACEGYFILVAREDTADRDEALDAAKSKCRTDARVFFDLSAGQTWEPAPLGEARVLYVEGRFAEALAKARQAFKDNPWLYEAKVEEAYALSALGAERQRQGDRRGALSLYMEASVAAQLARTIGHSDDNCYFSDLEWRLYWVENQELGLAQRLAHLAEAERLANQVLVIRPDKPRALLAMSYVMLCRAELLGEAGQDPEAELKRAERFLAPAGEVAALREVAALKRRQIEAVRARFPRGSRSSPWAAGPPG
jgi:serine/threonine-protein kinase